MLSDLKPLPIQSQPESIKNNITRFLLIETVFLWRYILSAAMRGGIGCEDTVLKTGRS